MIFFPSIPNTLIPSNSGQWTIRDDAKNRYVAKDFYSVSVADLKTQDFLLHIRRVSSKR